jgi:hypothetical protein
VLNKTENYSCSDLQSLVYSSFLLDVKEKIKNEDNSPAFIYLENLLASIKENKPNSSIRVSLNYKNFKLKKENVKIGVDQSLK